MDTVKDGRMDHRRREKGERRKEKEREESRYSN